MPRLKFFQKFLGTFKVFYCSHLRLKIRTIFLIHIITLIIRGVKPVIGNICLKTEKKIPENFWDIYTYELTRRYTKD